MTDYVTGPKSVQVLLVSRISPTSVSVEWKEDPPLAYNCTYSFTVTEDSCAKGQACDKTVNVTGQGRQRTVTDMVPGRSYQFSVVSVRHNVSSQPLSNSFRSSE